MAAISILEPNSLLRLECFAEHPMCQYTVRHGGKENGFRQLQKVVLRETLARHKGSAQSLSPILKFSPGVLLNSVRQLSFEEALDVLG